MTLPHVTTSWISVVLYCLLIFIAGMGLWQSIRMHLQHKSGFLLHSLVPLGMVALAFSFIGLIKSYTTAFELADSTGEMTKIELAHTVVHGSLNGAPYMILGLLCLGLTYFFKYLNPAK